MEFKYRENFWLSEGKIWALRLGLTCPLSTICPQRHPFQNDILLYNYTFVEDPSNAKVLR